MNRELVILLVEDDEGHATLIQKNLRRAGIKNKYLHFKDGQEILDYLFFNGDGPHRKPDQTYMMLLDIRMPRVDGIEVLKKVKADKELNNIPITMLTTTDNPDEINRCHFLGCNNYITKPVDYEKFIDVLAKLGLFLTIVKIPDA
ncbi:MAG: response regulator [Melioribacteraceae bacterium]|nr:response regulator [Melioribacteraceae bacterium]